MRACVSVCTFTLLLARVVSFLNPRVAHPSRIDLPYPQFSAAHA